MFNHIESFAISASYVHSTDGRDLLVIQVSDDGETWRPVSTAAECLDAAAFLDNAYMEAVSLAEEASVNPLERVMHRPDGRDLEWLRRQADPYYCPPSALCECDGAHIAWWEVSRDGTQHSFCSGCMGCSCGYEDTACPFIGIHDDPQKPSVRLTNDGVPHVRNSSTGSQRCWSCHDMGHDCPWFWDF